MADRSSRDETVIDRKCHGLVAALGFVLAALVALSPARAQVTWEYSPYQIEAWVEFEPAPEFTPRFREEMYLLLQQLAEIEVGAPWALTAQAMPSATRDELAEWLVVAADPK